MFHRWTRDLHLYIGLFLSPFVLLFTVSVLFLNHAKVRTDAWTSVRTVEDLEVPGGIAAAQGPEAVAMARMLLPQVEVDGEVGFTNYNRRNGHFVFPLTTPGWEARVDVDVAARSATVSRRETSTWEAFAYLHKMPGPHNVDIRGNWVWTRVWRWFADGTVYLLLFVSLSGIYLWTVLKGERRIGLTLLTAGAASFAGLIYAVIR
jgi:hypothetical protein